MNLGTKSRKRRRLPGPVAAGFDDAPVAPSDTPMEDVHNLDTAKGASSPNDIRADALRHEGVALAEAGDFSRALSRWDTALRLGGVPARERPREVARLGEGDALTTQGVDIRSCCI